MDYLPYPLPKTLNSQLKPHDPIDRVVPVDPSEKRIANYVQIGIRPISFRAPYTPGSFVIGRPFSLVSAQTTALRPLVFQNEFAFGLNVKRPARFKKKKNAL
jgi:hypothetical protein